MPLPRCFFDIAINGIATGRIVFELFNNVVPKTAENFRCLCTGERGEGKTTAKPLHYSGTPIHRIVKGFVVQGGDFSRGDGTGGESIYGGEFKDEGFHFKHDKPFLLSMANKGPNTNGSQFFITTRPAPHLDGVHVVFGHVINGHQFVTEMENQKVDTNHRPYADVRIINSGELVRMSKGKKVKRKVAESSPESSEVESSDSSPSDSESETEENSSDERRKRRHHTKRKIQRKLSKKEKTRKKGRKEKVSKKKSKKKRSTLSDSESDSEQSGDDHVTSTMADEDEGISLPPELVKEANNSWLYRQSKTPSPLREQWSNDKTVSSTKAAAKVMFKPRKKHEVSQSGRKLKGRGLMRYKTPPKHFDSRAPWEARGYPNRRRRSRSRSPIRRRSRSRSPIRRRSRSRSPIRRRSRSRSPIRRRSRSRSPIRRRSRSRSPIRRRSRSKSRERVRRTPESMRARLGNRVGSPLSHKRGDRIERRSISKEREDSRRDSRRRHYDESLPSPERSQRRRRSSYDRDSPRRGRRRSRSRSDERENVASKWARHRDSIDSSSDEEDDDIERSKRGRDEDLFGLAKLTKEVMS